MKKIKSLLSLSLAFAFISGLSISGNQENFTNYFHSKIKLAKRNGCISQKLRKNLAWIFKVLATMIKQRRDLILYSFMQ